MITLAMSQEEKEAVAAKCARKLYRLCPNAEIAGGYPRDIILGRVKPKDIDIFINANLYPSIELRDQLADRIFKAFGQTWTKDGEQPTTVAGTQMTLGNLQAVNASGNPYANSNVDVIEAGFATYFAATNKGDWENLNLIFSAGNNRAENFDFSICKFYITTSGRIVYASPDRDISKVQIMPTVAQDNQIARTIAHGERLRRKYPEMRFCVRPEFVLSFPETYVQLVEGGLLNAPRQVLPAQGEVPNRDEVRQQTRAVPRNNTGWVTFDEAMAAVQEPQPIVEVDAREAELRVQADFVARWSRQARVDQALQALFNRGGWSAGATVATPATATANRDVPF